MSDIKTYLVSVYRCPHCFSELNYSSESISLEKSMHVVFSLLNLHKSRCESLKGRKWGSVSVRENINQADGYSCIKSYSTNKILF
jgi:hypothetical protein